MLTEEKLKKFIRIRNKSYYHSNLQFMSDCESAGFKFEDLGPCRRPDILTYEWDTPFGTLVELGSIFYKLVKAGD